MPTVSICIPTYNRPELLERAVRSCLAQTYPDFEVIITDNSPGDESGLVAARFGDPRIRYFKNDANMGACASCNRGVSLAQGRYIKFLMDDDLLKPQCLARMVEGMERHPSAGIVMAPMDLIDLEDRRIFPRFYVFRRMHYRYRYQVGDGLFSPRVMLKEFLTRDYPCCVPSGILMRTECFTRLGLFDPTMDFAIDLHKVMQVATCYDFCYLDEVLSSWRYMPASHTASLHQTGLKISVFYRITNQILENKETRELFVQEEWPRVVRDSIFFCSCRALLNGLAGLRARNPSLIADTIRTIFREDRFLMNKLRLPFWVLSEIFSSVFPRNLPPPRI
jgi:glycosyltransferase involved in cell wall biosynthesis